MATPKSETIHDIYLVTCLATNKSYVGQTKHITSNNRCGRRERWNAHCRSAITGGGCPELRNAIKQYGRKEFVIKTLIVCPESQVDVMETIFIRNLRTLRPNGYNIMSGRGGGGHTFSDASKDRISESKRLIYVSPEDKAHVLAAMAEIGISKIPRKISFKTKDKRGFEGWIVDLGGSGKRKQFSAKALSLAEKLRRALAYLEASKQGEKALAEEKRKNEIEERKMSDAASVRRRNMLPDVLDAMADNGITKIPPYIIWRPRDDKFLYQRPGHYKAFPAFDSSESLKLALSYANSISR